MNREAALLARAAADEWSARTPERLRFVAGYRPTNRLLSISPDVEDPAARSITFEELRAAYAEQVRGLVEGGVDLLFIETIIDALNAKAAIAAIDDVAVETGVRLPVMISVTITDLQRAHPRRADDRGVLGSRSPTRAPSAWASTAPSAPPRCGPTSPSWRAWPTAGPPATRNAGLPNVFGEYDEPPEHTAAELGEFAASGLVNIMGGCRGTTPDYIRAIADAARARRLGLCAAAGGSSPARGPEPGAWVPDANSP